MQFHLENLDGIYAMIGPAGVVLIFVAFLAFYIILWQLVYMTAVWTSKRARTATCAGSTRSAPTR